MAKAGRVAPPMTTRYPAPKPIHVKRHEMRPGRERQADLVAKTLTYTDLLNAREVLGRAYEPGTLLTSRPLGIDPIDQEGFWRELMAWFRK